MFRQCRLFIRAKHLIIEKLSFVTWVMIMYIQIKKIYIILSSQITIFSEWRAFYMIYLWDFPSPDVNTETVWYTDLIWYNQHLRRWVWLQICLMSCPHMNNFIAPTTKRSTTPVLRNTFSELPSRPPPLRGDKRYHRKPLTGQKATSPYSKTFRRDTFCLTIDWVTSFFKKDLSLLLGHWLTKPKAKETNKTTLKKQKQTAFFPRDIP